MNKAVIAVMILVFISLHTVGQQSQDTLFLKDGSKVTGTLIGKTKNEYKLQSTDGMVFIFDQDSVVRIVPTRFPITNATDNLLTADELTLYRDKSSKMRAAGKFLTYTGIGCIVAEILIIGYAFGNDAGLGLGGVLPMIYGIPAVMIGIPLWSVGNSRLRFIGMDISELTLNYDRYSKMRNTGMIATFGGLGLIVTGLVINSSESVFPVFAGVVSTFVGIPLWATGGGMRSAAELAIQKFNIEPQGSLTLGLGLTIRF